MCERWFLCCFFFFARMRRLSSWCSLPNLRASSRPRDGMENKLTWLLPEEEVKGPRPATPAHLVAMGKSGTRANNYQTRTHTRTHATFASGVEKKNFPVIVLTFGCLAKLNSNSNSQALVPAASPSCLTWLLWGFSRRFTLANTYTTIADAECVCVSAVRRVRLIFRFRHCFRAEKLVAGNPGHCWPHMGLWGNFFRFRLQLKENCFRFDWVSQCVCFIFQNIMKNVINLNYWIIFDYLLGGKAFVDKQLPNFIFWR